MGTAGASTVTVCVQCGHRLDADAARCGACGHVVERSVLPAQAARRRHSAALDSDGTVPVLPGAVAPVGRRLVALLLDQAVGGLLVVLGIVAWLGAGLATGPMLLLAVLALSALILGAQLVAEAVTGATLGGAMLGIRTVGARTGLPGGLIAILVRDLVLAAGSLVAGIGAYVVAGSGAWDPSPARRGWHDKVAGTMVLRAWAVPARDDHRASTSGTSAGGTPARGGERRPGELPAPLPEAAVTPRPAPLTGEDSRTEPSDPQPSDPQPSDSQPSDTQSPGPRPSVPGSQLVPGPTVVAASHVVHEPPASAAAHTQVLAVVPPAPTPPATTPPAPTPPAPTPPAPTPPAPTPPAPTPAAPPPAAPPQGGGTPAEHGPELAAPTSGARLPDEIELTRLTPDRPVELLPEAWLRLECDTGEVIDVVGDGAIGRDPAHSSGRSAHHQVALQDPDRALSRLHLLFGPEQGGALLWVSDPGSTNGTVLQDPTGAVAVLAPGVRAVIGAGWQLKLGDRTVRVSAIV